MDSLFGYPGNKRKIVKSLDYASSTVFIDPFVGAASFLLHNYSRVPDGVFIVADKDPAIRAVLECCKSKELSHNLITETQYLRDQFLKTPTKTWNFIKKTIGKGGKPFDKAVCKLLYQKISHGCIPRTKADKVTPNVIWSVDKVIKSLDSWVSELPDLSQCDLTILGDYGECLKATPSDSTVFLDPPYYAPSKSKCYPGHEPNKITTLLMVCNSIRLALETQPKQLFVTHYYNPIIDNLLTSYCEDYTIVKTMGETLDSLNYGQGNFTHGMRNAKKVIYKDCLWTLNKK